MSSTLGPEASLPSGTLPAESDPRGPEPEATPRFEPVLPAAPGPHPSAPPSGSGRRPETPVTTSRPEADRLDDVPVGVVAGLAVAVAAAIAAVGTSIGVVALVLTTAAGLGSLAALVERRRAVRLQRALAAADERANHDSIAGVLNRDGIVDDIDRRLRSRRSSELVGVLFLDIDRLRVINHSIGHRAGDEVLRAVADRIATVLRPHDAVGRLGAEFVVAASGVRAVSDLERLAGRILGVLTAPVGLSDGSRQVVTASIGIAYALKQAVGAEDLIHEADTAMHRAKAAGGSCSVTFDADLRAQVEARIELERQLRRAVVDGELVVQYQPIVASATGAVEVVEALVRWRHPTRGLVPPGQFLTVASESGSIVPLGRHVLSTACGQAVQWSRATARPVAVAVNLAERQLFDRGLVAMVGDVLAGTGLPPAQLQLEVSEGLLVCHPEAAADVLRRLAAMGVRVAVDDFGASHASLRRLRELDMVRVIKLDGSFVARVADDPVEREVVSAVVALARSLGMQVVAEGVETTAQAAVLAAVGVDHLQGFLLQRPAVASAVTAWLDRPVRVPGTELPPRH